ncbi:hypothetical protein CEY12_11000 [Chryseobacterium sp. T16E-39]|uniref:hypothetical protein n=1 Tax=Chryseobacterium sp. T16E-39 TaxID=2015076 RepID=UPI000B5B29BB|nr:hypothetical protein [Chryseobacterium sp. T16E-39]ASK30606.1 hypothetical protein CEY12_11000 [Chryseobacterium sp. T16E-39]
MFEIVIIVFKQKNTTNIMRKLLIVAAIAVAGSMSANVLAENKVKVQENGGNDALISSLVRDWKITYGYGDDGSGCMVYGHYLTGDNGVTIFTACRRCVGFTEICPPDGGGFA